jgi:GNAT superfamily N-acetyltransferase
MTEVELAHLVELSEARAYFSLMSAAPPDFAECYGFKAKTMGSAVLVMAEAVATSVNLNRVIGLGVAEPATEDMLDEVCASYAQTKAPFGIELSPAAKPDDLPEWLRARRLRRAFLSRILYRDGSPPRAVYNSWVKTTGLRVERTGSEHAMTLAKLSCQNFRMPDRVEPVIAATVSRPGWRNWVAFDGDQPAGGSLSYVEREVCWLGWTSVLPSYRGRWVHAGIVAKQLQDAYEAGCTWVTTETASGTKENPDPAYYNLKNFGFRDVYVRSTYIGQPHV